MLKSAQTAILELWYGQFLLYLSVCRVDEIFLIYSQVSKALHDYQVDHSQRAELLNLIDAPCNCESNEYKEGITC